MSSRIRFAGRRHLAFFLSLLVVLTVGAAGKNLPQAASSEEKSAGKQRAAAQNKETAAARSTSAKSASAIEIKVESFRKVLIAGEGVGVFADITNTSDAPVYFREEDVLLILAPEVERSLGEVWSTKAFFPTERGPECCYIALKPTETYRAFWNRDLGRNARTPPEGNADEGVTKDPAKAGASREASGPSWLGRSLDFVGFAPGEYPITVEIKYWDSRKFDGDNYHTVFETRVAQFAAPQVLILIGAAFGSLIFVILAFVRKHTGGVATTTDSKLEKAKTATKMVTKAIATIVGSILLSWMITILLSRLSETQFFIKITVSDFWGAIAVGFLANYGGWALLDKMVPVGGGSNSSSALATTGSPATAAKDDRVTEPKIATVTAEPTGQPVGSPEQPAE